ncbi:outer membrane protein assembly factor [Thiohalobacter sp. COW1]|uniref:Translocation and assembly module subunit TamA n=1 Tax=Thiohalobacter thiocyanaticus TaxID=585455 RepID=A0A1Z4VR63_9GAMM|nr:MULTISPECIES: autotransporter assembly complex family protein [Thiohalobacter]BAZ94117.1 surface antigen [Thiohalobacter thiocyanaticus]BCO30828.1 outer membrane protein assembly factor [Thiohalobacter sp. COW1]
MSVRRFFILLLLMLCPQLLPAAEIDIRIEGLEQDSLRANVLALLSLTTLKDREAPSEVRVRRYFNLAEREIRTALEPFGYYRPRIESRLRRTEAGWQASFGIDPGEPVRVRELALELQGPGREAQDLQALIDDPLLGLGEVAVHARYEALKKSLLGKALELGYLDAAYTRHELRIDPAAGSATVLLQLDTGRRYRFGEISFEAAGLRETLLRRYLSFAPGEPYSDRKLLELQRALLDSDYFESVSVVDQREAAQDYAIPIEVRLEPRKRHRYTAGIGFGTDTGVRGKLGWEVRRINSRGHTLSSELRASEIRQGAHVEYGIPVRNPRTDRLSFAAAVQQEDSATIESDSRTLAANLSRVRGRLRENLSLTFLDEDFRLGDQKGSTRLLMPGVAWTYIKADDPLITRHGWRAQLELRGATPEIISETRFLQLVVGAKYILPLGSRGRILTRGQLGTTWMSDFDVLPASVRFFAGGDRSVRGFDYQKLGPTDASGEVVGGRHLLIGSLEYEHRIKGKWRAAVFVDTGNAFDDFGDELETGAGIGVRWESPVGLLRVDIASAVSRPDNPLRLHITLGPDL